MSLIKSLKSLMATGKAGTSRGKYPGCPESEKIIEQFHRLYYDSGDRTWKQTCWLGVPVQKCPFDLWVYQEIISDMRPDVIIETGTLFGGSAYYLATMFDLLGHGRVISIDIEERAGRPQHERITYLTGSSTDSRIVERVTRMVAGPGKVMVILDSDHSMEHVRAELETYAPLVSPGSYLIVEDSNVNGHPVYEKHGPGPMEAVEKFIEGNREYTIDREKEKFFLTFNPKGFLKKNEPDTG
ncbi:MAG: CmcI family methyltransferase [Gemmatimonadota bacterium]|nr:CmcI family methyltransferase [Gemmatimonadota bacterium]